MGRVTIVLYDKLRQKLHLIQADKIKSTKGSVSFSAVINEVLAEALKVKID